MTLSPNIRYHVGMTKRQEIFISTDIESDGRVPGLSSMLSFASAAFDIDKNLIGTFSRNLELLPEGKPEDETSKFWAENPEAYDETRKDQVTPLRAFTDYLVWVKDLPGIPIFVGYPAVFDFKWIDYYFVRYCGTNPFGFSRCVDVKSYAWARLQTKQFSHCSKRNFPKSWFDDLPHTHVALDDAIEQGAMFINMHRETLGLSVIDDLKREDK